MEIKAPDMSPNTEVMSYKANKMKVMECIREFPLPKQFPSTAKEASRVTWKRRNVMQLPTLKVVNGIKIMPFYRADTPVPCKKLRIVSSHGKDLGEFNVELRNSRNNPSKGQILTITKSNNSKLFDKPVTIALPAASLAPKQTFPRILRPESIKMARRKLMDISTNVSLDNKCVFNDCRVIEASLKKTPVLLPIKEVGIMSDGDGEAKRIRICNGNIDADKISTSVDERNSKYSVDCAADSNSGQKCIETELMPITLVKSNGCPLNNANVVTSTTLAESNIVSSTAANVSFKKIAESPFPIVSCVKLAAKLSDDCNRAHFKTNEKNHAAAENEEKTVKSSDSASSSTRRFASQIHSKIDRDSTRPNINSGHKESWNNERVLKHRNLSQKCLLNYGIKQTRETRIERNVMTVIPNNESFDKIAASMPEPRNAMISSSDNDATSVTVRNAIHAENECISLENSDSSIEILETDGIDGVDTNAPVNRRNRDRPEKSSLRQDLSDNWDIIKEAVSSVKDEELRALALKALADCGIGVERQVPIRPPEKLKAVHDAQMQTTVFGLLDPKFFVLINKDLDHIQRIPQTILHDVPSCVQNPLLENDLYLHSSGGGEFNVADAIEKTDFDLDEFIDKFCEENSSALQVKKTLSTTTARCENIIKQLQKDYESVKRYNQDGMLNIHVAVVSNNIYDVQRHLMILKQCRESVDVLTQNGEVDSILSNSNLLSLQISNSI